MGKALRKETSPMHVHVTDGKTCMKHKNRIQVIRVVFPLPLVLQLDFI